MSACNFNLPFTGTATALVANLQTQVDNNGGTFSGDDNSGSFSVPVLGSSVSGTYAITGQELFIDIASKPWFASCSAIENYVKGHLPG